MVYRCLMYRYHVICLKSDTYLVTSTFFEDALIEIVQCVK